MTDDNWLTEDADTKIDTAVNTEPVADDPADQTVFVVSAEKFGEFQRSLDRPIETAKLTRLFSRRPVWNQPIQIYN